MLERDNQTDNMAAFAAKEQPMASERPTCKHCGRYGHEETNCYEILGYPQNCGSQGRGHGRQGSRTNRGGRDLNNRGKGLGREVLNAARAQFEATAGQA